MRVFKAKGFARFARRERVSDVVLCDAVRRAERGLLDADLGGGIIKQRVARPGQGRSGGYRVLIAYRAKTRSAFLFGFAKSAHAGMLTRTSSPRRATSPKSGSKPMDGRSRLRSLKA